MPTGLIAFLGLLSFAWLVGCQQAPAPSGRSGFQFIRPEEAPPKREKKREPSIQELSPQTVFTDAEAIEPLEVPVFPSRALSGRAGLATVGVRLTVSHTGKVIDAGPSPLAVTLPGPYVEDFRRAIDMAVRHWRFNPAEIRQVAPEQKGKGPIYWVVIKSEAVETKVDVAFTFTASGKVEMGPGTKP